MKHIPRIKRLVQKYKKRLGLEDYHIEVLICEDKSVVGTRVNKVKISKMDYNGSVTNKDFNTSDYTIVVSKSALKNNLEDTICHEMLHILFWGYSDLTESLAALSDMSISQQERFFIEIMSREHDVIQRLITFLKR